MKKCCSNCNTKCSIPDNMGQIAEQHVYCDDWCELEPDILPEKIDPMDDGAEILEQHHKVLLDIQKRLRNIEQTMQNDIEGKL